MQHSLTLFANSAAGSTQSEQLQALWQKYVPASRRGEAFFFEPDDSFDLVLARALSDCRRRSGVLMIAGGDGTISGVVNKIAGTEQIFAVLPQGTFNFFARSQGIPLDPVAALAFALRAEPTPIALAYLNNHPFIVNAGLGLYPRVIAARESHQQLTGRSGFSAVISGLVTLLSERHLSRARLYYDDYEQRLLTPLLMINHNRQQLEQLDPRFIPEPGRLTVLRMRPVSSLALLKLLANGLTGRLLDEENIECSSVSEFRVHMRGSSVRIALDGELINVQLPLHFYIRQNSIGCLLNGKAV